MPIEKDNDLFVIEKDNHAHIIVKNNIEIKMTPDQALDFAQALLECVISIRDNRKVNDGNNNINTD